MKEAINNLAESIDDLMDSLVVTFRVDKLTEWISKLLK